MDNVKKPSHLNLTAQIVGFLSAAFLLTYGLVGSFHDKDVLRRGVLEATMFGGSVLVFVTIATKWPLVGSVLLLLEGFLITIFMVIRCEFFHPAILIIPLPIFTSGLLFLTDYFKAQKKNLKR